MLGALPPRVGGRVGGRVPTCCCGQQVQEETCTHTLLLLFTLSQGDPFRVYARSKNTFALWKYAITLSGSGPAGGLLGSNDDSDEFVQSLSMLFLKQPAIPTCNPQTVKELMDQELKDKDSKEEEFPSPSYFTKNVEKDSDFDICKVQLNPLLIFLHIDQGFITDIFGRFTPFASPLANSRSMYKEQVEKLRGEIMDGKRVVACEDFAVVPFEVDTQPPDSEAHHGEHLEYRCTLDRDTTSQNIVRAKRAKLVTVKGLTTTIKNVSAPNHGLFRPCNNGLAKMVTYYSGLWI